jgi:hypothetical protein
VEILRCVASVPVPVESVPLVPCALGLDTIIITPNHLTFQKVIEFEYPFDTSHGLDTIPWLKGNGVDVLKSFVTCFHGRGEGKELLGRGSSRSDGSRHNGGGGVAFKNMVCMLLIVRTAVDKS